MTVPPVVQPSRSRRAVGRLIRVALVVLAVVIAGSWLMSKVHFRDRSSTMPSGIVRAEQLQPGDVRIVSEDGNVSLTLQADRLLAGLSPERVAEVRAKIEQSAARDTGGLGGSIAQMVKKTVADNIGAQLSYALADINSITEENGQIVLHMKNGRTNRIFESTKVDNRIPVFSREDTERLIAAFEERKARP